jgi:hypothetical protein
VTIRRALGFASSLAFHVTAFVTIVWMSSLEPGPHDQRQTHTAPVAVFVVPPPEAEGLPGLHPFDEVSVDPVPTVKGETTILSIPHLTFDFKKISERSTLLFPFLTPGLSLGHFGLVPPSDDRHLHNPFAASDDDASATDRKRTLVLDGLRQQALIDESWSRRDRWKAFQHLAALADRYSANDGTLPHVLQMYVEQNGLQPYADPGARDHRLWAQLAVAADHADFIGFISRYASAHPSSKATTDLLLLLDTLVQANLNDLATLMSVEPSVDLTLTRRSNQAAYDFIVEVQQYYKVQLEKKHLASPEGIAAYYDAIRLEILDSIIRVTPQGYHASDARFLMGEIYWRQKNIAAAMEAWRGMTIDDSDIYVTTYSEILSAIAGSSVDSTLAIDRALTREHGRWRVFSYERLKQFGFQFDTF